MTSQLRGKKFRPPPGLELAFCSSRSDFLTTTPTQPCKSHMPCSAAVELIQLISKIIFCRLTQSPGIITYRYRSGIFMQNFLSVIHVVDLTTNERISRRLQRAFFHPFPGFDLCVKLSIG